MNTKKKSKTVEDLKNCLMDLMLDAKRVFDKYGHNENDGLDRMG